MSFHVTFVYHAIYLKNVHGFKVRIQCFKQYNIDTSLKIIITEDKKLII